MNIRLRYGRSTLNTMLHESPSLGVGQEDHVADPGDAVPGIDRATVRTVPVWNRFRFS